MPLLSIITVVYNARETLQGTLDSIISQTFRDFEIVVIDGASNDGTKEIVEANIQHISFYTSEPDKGIYDAMNKGLKAAIGDYVLFMNAGDQLFSPDTLEKVMKHAPQADVIYGRTMLIDDKGNELGERRLKVPAKLHWRSFNKGMLVSHQAFIARRSLTGKYSLDFRISSDIDWCIRVMKASVVLVNSHTYIARYLVGGLSRQRTRLAWKERYEVMRRHYGLARTLASHLYIIVRFAGYFIASRKLD